MNVTKSTFRLEHSKSFQSPLIRANVLLQLLPKLRLTCEMNDEFEKGLRTLESHLSSQIELLNRGQIQSNSIFELIKIIQAFICTSIKET
jgi:hypothetical protein